MANKFSLLMGIDNNSDDDFEPQPSTNKKKEATLMDEEHEIAKALAQHNKKGKNKKQGKVVITDEWNTTPPTVPTSEPSAPTQPTASTSSVSDKDKVEEENNELVYDSDKRTKLQQIRNDKLLENKVIFDENKTYGDIGDDKKLNCYWTVWVHRTSCTDWKITGYQKIYVINSLGSFWRFFNNFQMLNTYQNNIFIMREEIAPIWEDVNNKFGGICSLKIDSIQRGLKTDISTEIFTIMSMLIINETLVKNNSNINGISFGVKKRSALIKVWTKTYDEINNFIKELPVPLINKFNVEMQKQSSNVLNNDGKISIQFKKIKPEYEL